jgi:hypothetical protein
MSSTWSMVRSPLWNLLQEHAARGHADGAALALVGRVLYVLVVVCALEVHRHHIPAAGVAAGIATSGLSSAPLWRGF